MRKTSFCVVTTAKSTIVDAHTNLCLQLYSKFTFTVQRTQGSSRPRRSLTRLATCSRRTPADTGCSVGAILVPSWQRLYCMAVASASSSRVRAVLAHLARRERGAGGVQARTGSRALALAQDATAGPWPASSATMRRALYITFN